MTQEQMSQACGWASQGAFYQYLAGIIPLNIEALIVLAESMKVNPAAISPALAAVIQRGLVLSSDASAEKKPSWKARENFTKAEHEDEALPLFRVLYPIEQQHVIAQMRGLMKLRGVNAATKVSAARKRAAA